MKVLVILMATILLITGCTYYRSTPPTASIEPYGSLNDPIANTVEVTPGKYEVTLPFTLKNLSTETSEYRVRIEPGLEHTITVTIKEVGQGSLQVQLVPKIEIR